MAFVIWAPTGHDAAHGRLNLAVIRNAIWSYVGNVGRRAKAGA